MTMTQWIARVALAACVIGGTVVPAAATEPWPPFSVAAPEGGRWTSASIGENSRALVVYVVPGSPSAERLFAALDEWQVQGLEQHLLVLVAAPLDRAREYMRRWEAVLPPGLTWAADDRREAWQALGITGSPVLFGVANGEVAWKVAGVLNEPGMLESIVRTWVEQR
jgi:hypothetical protein